MARRILTDDSGRWFDDSKAVKFSENTRWNGNNHISCATGSQWSHETLYYSKSGNWILNAWSQFHWSSHHYEGTLESYSQVSEDVAIDWLVSQNCFDDEDFLQLPEEVQDRVRAGMEAAEI